MDHAGSARSCGSSPMIYGRRSRRGKVAAQHPHRQEVAGLLGPAPSASSVLGPDALRLLRRRFRRLNAERIGCATRATRAPATIATPSGATCSKPRCSKGCKVALWTRRCAMNSAGVHAADEPAARRGQCPSTRSTGRAREDRPGTRPARTGAHGRRAGQPRQGQDDGPRKPQGGDRGADQGRRRSNPSSCIPNMADYYRDQIAQLREALAATGRRGRRRISSASWSIRSC